MKSRMDRGRRFYLELFNLPAGWDRATIANRIDSRVFPWFIRDFTKLQVVLVMDPDIIHHEARKAHG